MDKEKDLEESKKEKEEAEAEADAKAKAEADEKAAETGALAGPETKTEAPVNETQDLTEVSDEDRPYEGETATAQAERIARESNLEAGKYLGPPVDRGEFNANPPEVPDKVA